MAKASEPFARRNIREGWPQLNNINFAFMVAKRDYPALAMRMVYARRALNDNPSTENAKALFDLWKEVCRRVREERV